MTSRILSVSFDCHDPYRLAQFWAGVTGFVEHPDFPNEPDDPEAVLIDPKGLHPELLFLTVPEGKAVKNRIHLDLRPDVLRDDEVERVLGLGATMLDDRRNPDGTGWAVLADPEGNELCIVRSAAERDDVPVPVSTGERDMPAIRLADERAMLTAMLDWYRDGVVGKVRNIGTIALRGRPFESETSIAGLLKHLTLVELSWFSYRLDHQPEDSPWKDVDWDADPDWEFRTARDDELEDLVAQYVAACDRSRDVTGRHELDFTTVDERGREFSHRFVLLHMIEETARHLGHLDILRELLDGTTGE